MAISGRFVLLAGALWWGLGFPVVGRAQTVFVKNLLEANWTDVSWDRTLGTPFTVGDESARVSALGFFDEKGDGLAVAHEVGIYGPDHALLGKVKVQFCGMRAVQGGEQVCTFDFAERLQHVM